MEMLYAEHDCREIVGHVHASHLSSAINKELDFSRKVDDSVPATVLCDRMRLIQVLNNLVHNAIKFTPAGSVELKVRRVDDQLEFSVKDSGPGIPPEAQELIFEKFRQADGFISREHGGAGLGLALSKHLVELMGGKLILWSQAGKGCEFTFCLPLQPVRHKESA